MLEVMDFWLEMGVDGFRLDAVPYLVEREGTTCENLPETHAIIKAIRRHIDERYPNRMLLAEANQLPADVRAYFGDGDECHMAYHFPLMPRIFMALHLEDRHPITEMHGADAEPFPTAASGRCSSGTTTSSRSKWSPTTSGTTCIWRTASEPQARLNLGIRRRLAPLLGNNRRRIELLTGLLFSFPGTPILYYGDEIGMGDNLYLGDRNGVRTPMQWTGDRNARFSRADPARLYSPVIMDPVYGYQAVNVEAQERDRPSLLHWMRNMIGLRKLFKVFGRGSMEFLKPDEPRRCWRTFADTRRTRSCAWRTCRASCSRWSSTSRALPASRRSRCSDTRSFRSLRSSRTS